ncbi:pyridoxal-phosphate-dependent aminotransferase family protein [Streptomyces cyaneofuscatus]|uniref:pyridoxal-phosphate-dependent aminotransferase family protein n=1 Tax=Streptomyces cyaneofuscatus TaxID=66883 RepID=UPI003807A4CE
MLNKHRLMVPGPTPLPPGVTAAATLPMADERTPEFAEVFTRVIRRLQHVLGTGNDVLMLTSSMTGAFESAVQNLFSPGERVLVLDNGLFGRRWVDMCRAFGLEVTELGAPWGSEIEPAAVADALAADPGITAVLCVHCETSTGVVNDIRSCAAAARSARGPEDGVLVVVDAASGLGACELRTDEWGVDVVVGGGQKALMTPPGMSFVSVSERAWRRQAEARLPRFYFDWSAAALAGRAEIPRTAWTPAIGVLVQMDAALAHLLDEGVEAALERHVLLGRMARGGFLGMGLRLLTPDRDANASVTAAYTPPGIDAERLVRHLADRFGLQMVAGSGAMADRIIRLGHCGYIDPLDIVTALAGVELSLHAMGAPVQPGAGTASAIQVLAHRGPGRLPQGALIALAADHTEENHA